MGDTEREADRGGGDHASDGREPDPESDAQAVEAQAAQAQAAQMPAEHDSQERKDDRECRETGNPDRQQPRAEADRNDGADAEETCSAHRGDRRCHVHRPGLLAVESEPRATADAGWSDGVDERTDPIAGDRVSPCQRGVSVRPHDSRPARQAQPQYASATAKQAAEVARSVGSASRACASPSRTVASRWLNTSASLFGRPRWLMPRG